MADDAIYQKFRDELAGLAANPPWRADEHECGNIVDATGTVVATVDVDHQRPDAEVEQLVGWIVLAVNTCSGFRAVETAEGRGS